MTVGRWEKSRRRRNRTMHATPRGATKYYINCSDFDAELFSFRQQSKTELCLCFVFFFQNSFFGHFSAVRKEHDFSISELLYMLPTTVFDILHFFPPV